MQAELARLMAENADLKTGVWKPAGGEEPAKPAALEGRCGLWSGSGFKGVPDGVRAVYGRGTRSKILAPGRSAQVDSLP